MFEQLFERQHAQVRQRNGPLAEERRRYLAHCAEQQMTPGTLRAIAVYTFVVAKALCMADRPGELVTRGEIEAAADEWANRHPRPKLLREVWRSRLRFIGHATRWLTFLGRLQTPTTTPQPYTDHLQRFADYMLRERGLSPRTVECRRRSLHAFLAGIDQAGLRLDTVTVAQVDDILVRKVREAGCAGYRSDLRFHPAPSSGMRRPAGGVARGWPPPSWPLGCSRTRNFPRALLGTM